MLIDPICWLFKKFPFNYHLIETYFTGSSYSGILLKNGQIGLTANPFAMKVPTNLISPKLKNPSDRVWLCAYYNALLNYMYPEADQTAESYILQHRPQKTVLVGLIKPIALFLIDNKFHTCIFDNEKSDKNILPPAYQKQYLAEADLAIITGSALANNTINGIRKNLKIGAKIVMLGPSVLLFPPAFGKKNELCLGGSRFQHSTTELIKMVEKGAGGKDLSVYSQKVCVI